MVVLLVLVVFAVLIYEVWSLVQLVRYAWGQWVEWWTSRTKGPATADSTATLVVGRDGDEARHSSSMKLEAEEMQQLPGSSSLGPSLVDLKSASAVIIASTHAPNDCDASPMCTFSAAIVAVHTEGYRGHRRPLPVSAAGDDGFRGHKTAKCQGGLFFSLRLVHSRNLYQVLAKS